MNQPIEPESSGNDFARAIRARRRRLRLRQAELAELAGVSERFIQALEKGKTSVQLDKVVAVLSALGLYLELRRGSGTQIRPHKDLAA